MTEQPMFQLENLSFYHANGQPALVDINLKIDPNERVVLLGANGSGKSTLLKILNGLIPITEGQIRFQGQELTAKTLKQKAFNRQFRQAVALMFQQPEAMLFNPTVAEEIAYGIQHLPSSKQHALVKQWAQTFALENQLDMPPSHLSGGEKQRLCLACLLVTDPMVLLLDEPSANLDAKTTGWLLSWLDRQNMTSVTTTHQLALARHFGQRAIVLGTDHRIVFDGSFEELEGNKPLLNRCNLSSDYMGLR
jgi:cobalt/nickel transport system ATP-binding protein